MANRWIEFVRKWSAKEGISYACAVSKPECRAEYQAKYGNRKKLPMRTEREIMGAEDIRSRTLEKQKKKKPALIIEESDEEEYILPKKTPLPKRTQKSIATEMVSPKLKQVMEKLKMLQEDLQSQMIMKKQMTATLRSKLSKELKTILDEKKRLVELSRMMGEDKDALSVVKKIERKMDSLTKYAIASKAKKMELRRQGVSIPRLKNAEELAKEAKEEKKAKETKMIIEESDEEEEDIPIGTADEIANEIYSSMPRLGKLTVDEKEEIRKQIERIEKIIERSFEVKKINKKEYNALKGEKMLGFLKTKIEDDEEVPKKKATKQKKKTAKEIREEEKRKKEEQEAKERADFYLTVLTSFKKEKRDVLPKEIYKKIQEWIIGSIRNEVEYEDAVEDSSSKYMNPNLEPELRNAFGWVYGKIYAKNQEEEEKKAPKKKAKKAKDELEDVFASMLKASKKNVNDDDDDDDDDEN
jgi:hypothetical protein